MVLAAVNMAEAVGKCKAVVDKDAVAADNIGLYPPHRHMVASHMVVSRMVANRKALSCMVASACLVVLYRCYIDLSRLVDLLWATSYEKCQSLTTIDDVTRQPDGLKASLDPPMVCNRPHRAITALP